VDGSAVCYRKHLYIMMNKPVGVLCATEDREGRTVIDLVPEALSRKGLFPAGRLDKDSEGFVLLTDDGVFCHQIISPKKNLVKTYIVHTDKPAEASHIELLESGTLVLDGKPIKKAQVRPLDENNTEFEVKISEGRHRQIRRMFDCAGLTVTFLQRIAIGSLFLDSALPQGGCRALSGDEYLILANSIKEPSKPQ